MANTATLIVLKNSDSSEQKDGSKVSKAGRRLRVGPVPVGTSFRNHS